MDIKSTADIRRYVASTANDTETLINKVSIVNSKTNKRKRRSTFDEKDIECNPSKRVNVTGYSYPTQTIATATCKQSKCKRRSTLDEEDIGSCPSKRPNLMCNLPTCSPHTQSSTASSSTPPESSPFSELDHEIRSIITDTQSSSECQSTVVEYDFSHLNSPPTPAEMSPASWPVKAYEAWRQDDCDINPGKSGKSCETEIPPKSPSDNRMCPLPALSWANASDVWSLMCEKDKRAAKQRSASMFENHPDLQPRMRAILLDWLIEVCEVYKLHRETYFLAVDYLDRYLSNTRKVQKTHFQLIGITCLFMAAKVEEIYPPKIGEFAYVTDEACQEEDILQHELLLLKALDWNVSPVTIMGWLGVYMQLNVTNRTPSSFSIKKSRAEEQSVNNKKYFNCNLTKSVNDIPSKNSVFDKNIQSDNNTSNKKCDCSKILTSSCSSSKFSCNNSSQFNKSNADDNKSNFKCKCNYTKENFSTKHNDEDDSFIFPQYSGMEFAQTAQLVDLCSLDMGIANYPYSVIAAAAISHTYNRDIAVRVSGLDWQVIEPCSQWMKPFFQVICEETGHLYLLEKDEQVKSKFGLGHFCPNIVTDDSHIIQTHSTSMDMFDKVMMKRDQANPLITSLQTEASPAVGIICPDGLLTPPASSRKNLEDEDIEEGQDKVGFKKETSVSRSKN